MARIINLPPGADHIVAKPWQHHNRPHISEGPGNGVAEAGGEGEENGTGGEGGEGKQESATNDTPPSPTEELAYTGRAI